MTISSHLLDGFVHLEDKEGHELNYTGRDPQPLYGRRVMVFFVLIFLAFIKEQGRIHGYRSRVRVGGAIFEVTRSFVQEQ